MGFTSLVQWDCNAYDIVAWTECLWIFHFCIMERFKAHLVLFALTQTIKLITQALFIYQNQGHSIICLVVQPVVAVIKLSLTPCVNWVTRGIIPRQNLAYEAMSFFPAGDWLSWQHIPKRAICQEDSAKLRRGGKKARIKKIYPAGGG